MPTPVDNLNKNSSKEQIGKAISECIAMEVKGGREQDQAVAMCHQMAHAKVGEGKYPFRKNK